MKHVAFFLLVSLSSPFGHTTELGLKNFRELYQSMKTVTGNRSPSSEIQNYYDANISKLPKYGKIQELDSSMLIATINLASYFCQVMIDSDTKRSPGQRWIHGTLPMNQPFSKWSSAQVEELLLSYALYTWGEDYAPQELSAARKLVSELSAEKISSALVGVCSLFLSSPRFLVK